MELSQLHAFISVLESGSMLEASRNLRISRATLRSRITALEEHLGVDLLVRTHRGVRPTEFGRKLAVRARDLLAEAHALELAASRMREDFRGQLYVRASVGLPPPLWRVLYAELSRRYPDVSLRLEITSDPVRDLPEDVDLVLHFAPSVPAGTFRTFALAHFPERLLATRDYLDAHGEPATLAELRGHHLLCWCSYGYDGASLPLLAGDSVDVEPSLISEDVFTLHSLAAAGQGIAFVPDSERVRGAVPGAPREIVLADIVGRQSSLWVLLPEAHADTPRSRAAVEILRDIGSGAFLPRSR